MTDDVSLLLPNLRRPQPELFTCGLPAPDDFPRIRAAGVKTVVSLCQPHETPLLNAFPVDDQGLQLFNIPVAGPQDLTEANARALADILNEAENCPVLVHCMSSNRVGALLALKAFFVDGASVEEALDAGCAGGLTGLEPEVRRLLTAAASQTC
ncbi:hypothetical protein [Hahella sp. HN01]|uniref:hypothetical protein n=1 Tax=unclassified Hahella TaxID=2624107 RepID=UPI001C1ED05B|nr:hypothetical protein [Hahella sp. HN01]MBU6954769.1 hypothetical protein [Hahella sp. HN01]